MLTMRFIDTKNIKIHPQDISKAANKTDIELFAFSKPAKA